MLDSSESLITLAESSELACKNRSLRGVELSCSELLRASSVKGTVVIGCWVLSSISSSDPDRVRREEGGRGRRRRKKEKNSGVEEGRERRKEWRRMGEEEKEWQRRKRKEHQGMEGGEKGRRMKTDEDEK